MAIVYIVLGFIVFLIIYFLFFKDNNKETITTQVETIKLKPEFHYYIEHWYKDWCYVKFMNPENGKYEYLQDDKEDSFSDIIRHAQFQAVQRSLYHVNTDFSYSLSKFKTFKDVEDFNNIIIAKVSKHNTELRLRENEARAKRNDTIKNLNKHLE